MNFSELAARTVRSAKSVRVVFQVVCNQSLDCHHHNRADSVEGVRKEVFDPGVKINGFYDADNVLGIRGISVQLVLVVESPEGVLDGVDKGAQVVHEGFSK